MVQHACRSAGLRFASRPIGFSSLVGSTPKRRRGRIAAIVCAAVSLSVVVSTAATADIDVPTGAPPSPLFGAEPFTVNMLRFEQFGLRPLPTGTCSTCELLPRTRSCGASPISSELDAFLAQPLHPAPTRMANTDLENPWRNRIGSCVRELASSSIEGRPPGEFFAHQRWGEFPPEVYFQTAQTGARTNRGLRDDYQMHGYEVGEFGPGGLYHHNAVTGAAGTTAGVEVRFHPNMPVQDPHALWTFDGTFPPKLLMARYGESILFRHHNALPVSASANYGFGTHTITTHEHNGHSPAESDGYTQAFFFPGQFFDYRWPMILAGHDSINVDASDPRAGAPDGNGGVTRIRGDYRETMSTHWFHDHMLDFTAQNVYKGNAAMMNYYSAIDRGNEGLDCHYEDPSNVNLCLPSGTDLDWGNRDYDVNLMVADKAWDRDGQLFFNIFNVDGFLGDRMTVNWLYKPYFEVRARRYRLRILNASISRYMRIAVVDESGGLVPFHMVANDGNIMEHAIPFPNAQARILPTQAIAERYDIVIDFSRFNPGDKVYLVNLLEHEDGRRPKEEIPLREVLSGEYAAGGGDPAVGKFLEFRVQEYSGTDRSMNPVDYEPGKKQMLPLPGFTQEELLGARHRTFEFGRSDGTDSAPWTIKTDGGMGFGMDPRRLSAAPEEGSVEIWHLKTGGGWSHPVHVHFEEGQILKRGGENPPLWERWARKDVYRIGSMDDSTQEVSLAIRFREFLGTYMEHCHNTQHEDHAMLLRWDVENPGETIAMPTPLPRWEGVLYDPSFTLPTFKEGDEDARADWADQNGGGGGDPPADDPPVDDPPADDPPVDDPPVDDPPVDDPPADDPDAPVFNVWRAFYDWDNAKWVFKGTTSIPPSYRFDILVGPTLDGEFIVSARVNSAGEYIRKVLDSGVFPDETATYSIRSNFGNVLGLPLEIIGTPDAPADDPPADDPPADDPPVDDPPVDDPPADDPDGPVFNVWRAFYDRSDAKWVFKGTTSIPPSYRFDILVGPTLDGEFIVTGRVKSDGAYVRKVIDSGVFPDETETYSIRSDFGNVLGLPLEIID